MLNEPNTYGKTNFLSQLMQYSSAFRWNYICYKILWDLNISWRTWFQTTDRMMDWFACMNAKMNHLPQEKRWVFFHRLKFIFSYSWVKTKMLWVINGNINVCYTHKSARRTHLFTKTGFWSKIQCWMNFTQLRSNLNEFEWNENVCATAFICIWIVCRYRCCCCCHTYSLSWFSYLYFVRCTCVCWCIER